MTNLKINVVTRTIEITKAFEKKASRVGTREYEEVVRAIKDFPKFKVVVKSTTPRENNHKNLTMAYMGELVREITKNNQEAIDEFDRVKNFYKNTNFHFSKVKQYFILKYPNYKDFIVGLDNQQQKREQVNTDNRKMQVPAVKKDAA